MLAAAPHQIDGGMQMESLGNLRIADRETLKEATWVALVKVARIADEPSGLGGDFVTFDVVRVLRGPNAKIVGFGAHGWRSQLTVGDLLLVSLTRDSKLLNAPSPPFFGSFGAKIDAAVTAMIPTDSVEKGAALFKQLQPTAKP
jgi:hypothetical protein